MRLYRTDRGQWYGTQAEARAEAKTYQCNWWAVIVPTDKPGLLEWLNSNPDANPHEEPAKAEEPVAHTVMYKPHPWQTIRECAEKASLSDMGIALAVVMNRLEEAEENAKV